MQHHQNHCEDSVESKDAPVVLTDTPYCGIHVQQQGEHYWIMDDNGGEQYAGRTRPTAAQVDAYREAAVA